MDFTSNSIQNKVVILVALLQSYNKALFVTEKTIAGIC